MKDSKLQAKEVKRFLSTIKNNEVIHKNGNHRFLGHNNELILDYLFSLEKKNFTALISSSYWNNYPSYTIDSYSKKPYGHIIYGLIRSSMNSSSVIRNLFIKKSSGLWHRISLDYLRGSERVSCAKRGIKSSDKRVRLQSVAIVPASILKRNAIQLLQDRHKSISWKLMQRLGPDNYPDIAMEYSSCDWTRRDAIRRNISGKDVALDRILGELDSLDSMKLESPYSTKKHAKRALVRALVERVKTSDVPFLLSSKIDHDLGIELGQKLKIMKWAQD
jgi:hypothetical protein